MKVHLPVYITAKANNVKSKYLSLNLKMYCSYNCIIVNKIQIASKSFLQCISI